MLERELSMLTRVPVYVWNPTDLCLLPGDKLKRLGIANQFSKNIPLIYAVLNHQEPAIAMRLFNKLVKEKKEDISGILADLEHIRTHSTLVNCVFRATGSSWLGVNIAGRSMFPDRTIELPQYYSNQVLSDAQISQVCEQVVRLGFRTFVFHGYVSYMSKLIYGIYALDKSINILFVHHGFVSELSDNDLQIRAFGEFISMCRDGVIKRIGVVKDGHEHLLSSLFGVPAQLLFNLVPIIEKSLSVIKSNGIHIGVLVNESYRKNMHTQVLAALMIKDAIVHVLNKSEFSYLPDRTRLVEHGMLSHPEFLVLLASMDINLHLTFSEASGGQVFTESLGCGVPCLTAYSNGFLNFDPDLKSLLSVSEADDPVAISERIKKILPMRQDLGQRGREYCIMMNKKAEESLQLFLQ